MKKSFPWYYFRSFINPQSTFELLLNNVKYLSYGFIYILIPLAQEILEEIEDNIDSEITTKFILLIILFLTYLSSIKDLDEANFWRPTGNAPLATLSQGEPLFFKLKKDYGNMIVGFGLFVLYKRIKFGEALT
jgi:hypothetical protein